MIVVEQKCLLNQSGRQMYCKIETILDILSNKDPYLVQCLKVITRPLGKLQRCCTLNNDKSKKRQKKIALKQELQGGFFHSVSDLVRQKLSVVAKIILNKEFQYQRFLGIFATSRKLVVIQLILVIKIQTIYQMKDIVHVYLLNDLIFEIVFEKVEKIVFENSIF